MIFLITPTGARAKQFELCSFYMRRQTYTGAVVWIIIDDAVPRSTDAIGYNFKPDWTIIKVYPEPPWQAGNTQARNMTVGINLILQRYKAEDIEAIFIIEDDDYYKPIYLERMTSQLKGYWACGEINTIYYNVVYRKYADNNNRQHSSLFQTAFTYDAIPIFQQSIPAKFIDAQFWMLMRQKYPDKAFMFNENNLSVGMKGLPGRKGIGAGHGLMYGHLSDQSGNYLKSLIGEEDAKHYEGYYRGSRQSQHPLFITKHL